MYHRDDSGEVTLRPEAAGGSIELARDFILPDSYADVKKVLGVTAMLSPGGGYTEEGKAYYSGEVIAEVLFVTDEGGSVMLPCAIPYEGTVAVGSEEGLYETVLLPSIDSLSARAVNPRKLGVKVRLEPSLVSFEERDAYVGFEDGLTEDDLDSFMEKTEPFSYLSARHIFTQGIEAGDDITLDEAYLPIGSLLGSDIRFSKVTAEAREDGVAVSGSADLTVLYKNETGEPVMRRHTLPVSTLVPCEGVREGDAVLVKLYCQGVSCKAGENAAGEARVIELDFTYSVEGAAMRKEEGRAVKDLYSTRYECENQEKALPVPSLVGSVSTAVRLVGEMNCEEKGVVLGSYGDLSPLRFADHGDGVALEGALTLTVILLGDEGEIFSRTLEMPILYPLTDSFVGRPELLSSVTLDEARVTLSGDLLSAEVSVGLSALLWEVKKEEMIVSTKVTAELERDNGALFTVYFPSAKEDAWEIAKRYRVSEDRLIFSENGGGHRRVLILPDGKKTLYGGRTE